MPNFLFIVRLLIGISIFHGYSKSNQVPFLNYKVFDQSSSIPQTNVTDCIQYHNGTIWISTVNGLYTYDGTLWKKQGVFVEGTDYSNISYLFLSISDSSIYTISRKFGENSISLFTFENNKWSYIDYPINKKRAIKNFIVYRYEGARYILLNLHEKGLLRLNGSKIEKIFDFDGIINIEVVGKFIYICTENGLFKSKKDLTKIEIVRGTENSTVLGVFQNSNSDIQVLSDFWIATVVGDSIKVNKSNVFSETTKYEHARFERSIVLYSKNVGLLFGTKSSLSLYNENLNSFMPLIRSTTSKYFDGIKQLLVDKEENIWACSPRGLYKIQKQAFLNYNTIGGLLEDEVSSILIDSVVILGHNSGFTFFNAPMTKIRIIDSLYTIQSNARVMDIKRSPSGEIYSAVSSLGIMQISNYNYELFEAPTGYTFYGLDFFDNSIYAGGNLGVCSIESGSNQLHAVTELTNLIVKDLTVTKEGIMLIASPDIGVGRYYRDTFVISDNSTVGNLNIYKVFGDSILYYLGTTAGLYTYNSIFNTITKHTDPFSIDRPVYMIEEDPKGRMWFGTDNGVYRWDGENLRHYTTSHGLIGPETNRNASAIDSLGRIWIGTNKGLSIYMEEWDWEPAPPPFVYLKDYYTSYDTINPGKPTKLRYNNNDITFKYVANSFIDEDKVFVSTKLDGYDSHWQPDVSSHIQTAKYTNLPPGQYTFQFKARGIDNIYSDVISTASITILPPFWKTWWFRSFLGIGILIGGYIVHYTIQRKKYMTILEDTVDDRTRHLDQSKRNYSSLIGRALDPIIEFDMNGYLTSWNSALCDVFGFSSDDLEERHIRSLFYTEEDYLNYWTGILQYIVSNDSTIVDQSMELHAITSIGEKRRTIFSTYTRIHDDEIIFTAFMKDITEQKRMERILQENLVKLESQREDLKRLSLEAIRIQETERKRISQDLHDQIGQSLSIIDFKLHLVGELKKSDKNIGSLVQECKDHVTAASKDIHRFTYELRPTILDEVGLKNSINEHIDQIAATSKLTYSVTGKINENLIPHVYHVIIYRIYQETLSNILKHAEANTIRIHFKQSTSEFHMTMEDNGKGFDLEDIGGPSQSGGYGILGMQERARFVGGSLDMNTSPGNGCKIKLTLPLDNEG